MEDRSLFNHYSYSVLMFVGSTGTGPLSGRLSRKSVTEDPGASEIGPASASASTSQIPVLETSLECVGCGYELHGLPFHGSCPECGKPIEHSLASISEARNAPLGIRQALRFINAGWLANAILILGCINLKLTLIIVLIGAAFRCFGCLRIDRSYRGSIWEGTGWPRWHAMVSALVTLGLFASLVLSIISFIKPGPGMQLAFMVTTMSCLFMICAESIGWLAGVRSWAKHTGYPALGPCSIAGLMYWAIPSFLVLFLIVFQQDLAAGSKWTGVFLTTTLVLICLGSIGNALLGNLFSDLIHQLEIVPDAMEDDHLAVRLRNARTRREPADRQPLVPAESGQAEIIPQRGGISNKRADKRTPRHDPPGNPGGMY